MGSTLGAGDQSSQGTRLLTRRRASTKVFYEENCWKEREEQTRLDMQPFKNLGLTFAAEETSAPMEIAPGKWETKHTARFDGGLVNMVFVYEQFGEDWLLTYAKPE